jgi:pyruvate dehydrogenase E1 component beta subunit
MDANLRELSYAQAIQEAMAIAMEMDERVFLMGEDIGVYGGAFQVSGDLVHRFGEDRVMDTPISELGGAGVAVGAAVTGMRPIFEFQFSDFATLAMEQIVNQAAKMRYMLGGNVSVPLVMRFPAGSGTGAAAQHSQSLEAWFAHVPGLKVLQPSTPHDAKGMLLAAVADPDPVMIFEHKLLYKTKGPVPEGYYTIPIGKSETRRHGRDLTIVATSIMVHKSLDAAAALMDEGIDVEVIDLRSLRPMDTPCDHRKREEDVPPSLRLRGRENPRHRCGDQRRRRRERSLRLSRRPRAAPRRSRGPAPLQSGAREGRRAAGSRHHRRRAQARSQGGLTCRLR